MKIPFPITPLRTGRDEFHLVLISPRFMGTRWNASLPVGNEIGSGLMPPRVVARGAFSLIEIMITVALMSFIVLGLLAMFHETQRAFRSSITQTDVLEGGRALTEMLSREMEQMTPANGPSRLQFPFYTTNFFAELTPNISAAMQVLPPGGENRTNMIQRFFFLTKMNQDWIGTGYQVIPDVRNAPLGALYRFSTNVNTSATGFDPAWLKALFDNAANGAMAASFASQPVTNMSKIADGIVHLQVRCFSTNGALLETNGLAPSTSGFFVFDPRMNPSTNAAQTVFVPMQNTLVAPSTWLPGQIGVYFISNAVPAAVEFEIGMLEPQILRRYKSLATPAAQLDYLSNHVGNVHLFRNRVTVRSVDTSPY
jgi:Tfp pilus assembly protein PilV